MQTLDEQQLLDRLSAGETFAATLADGSLDIWVREYVPYLCTAIHAGHRLRPDLEEICAIDEQERLREEDPYTDTAIESFPIALVARDSRYEYDLNRSPEECLYEVAWGKQVWQQPLDEAQRQTSQERHSRYYRILEALITQIQQRFGGCLAIDVHSYNWQIRQYEEAPIFNLGTAQLNLRRWSKLLKVFEEGLGAIDLPNLDTTVARNQVYRGQGFQAKFIGDRFPVAPVIPLEIKKVFMDEKTGEVFPLAIESLRQGLHRAVLDTAAYFNQYLGHSKLRRPAALLSSTIDPLVLKVDRALYRLAKDVDTLQYVNPINLQQEKRTFLARKRYEPNFRYRQLRMDPYDFREQLYQLPVSQISDPSLRDLYRSVVDSFAIKVELLTHVGTPQFLYNSLRYYGEPSPTDIANAHFLLHAPEIPGYEEQPSEIDAEMAKVEFERAARDFGLNCQVAISTRLVANAMVDNNRRLLLINRNAKLTQTELNALVHHELGVHMVTTMNALEQPLKVFRLGLPGNTYTQEGLAILAEYLSGNLNLSRLKQLAMRVLTVNVMLRDMDFGSIFDYLKDEHKLSDDKAFSLATRVFRGGGFTKDYLYLRGLKDIVSLYHECDINSLLIGKTSSSFLHTIGELIERRILLSPKLRSQAISDCQPPPNPVLDYLVSSIQ
ncbi:flavohemoglobin expression-modulating QEGLA motif protein [Synechococcus sp. PCC 7336]|uniref:flavohemoglobin expression-modulating QEGLA motif protein n=1 Tax=Synechococcus sp. PCC 7336 TaxID=195250 RepID=UPI0003762FEC|nr:flavohemoglobin expression-modulating QEGLA motif protein [Synechococcus sp. PCC 7336]